MSYTLGEAHDWIVLAFTIQYKITGKFLCVTYFFLLQKKKRRKYMCLGCLTKIIQWLYTLMRMGDRWILAYLLYLWNMYEMKTLYQFYYSSCSSVFFFFSPINIFLESVLPSSFSQLLFQLKLLQLSLLKCDNIIIDNLVLF